jgi:DNA-binding NarL/FixJ family response regulator
MELHYKPEWFILGLGVLVFVFTFFIIKSIESLKTKRQIRDLKQETTSTTDVSIYNLSPTETIILSLMIQGKQNAEIAEERNISLNTVKTHISNIYQKTGIRHRAQLISLVNSGKF